MYCTPKVTVTGPKGTLESFKHVSMDLTKMSGVVGKTAEEMHEAALLKTLFIDLWFATRKELACVRNHLQSHIDNLSLVLRDSATRRALYSHFPSMLTEKLSRL
jgi:hypothetical protein